MQAGFQHIGHGGVEDKSCIEDGLEVINMRLHMDAPGRANLELEGIEAQRGDSLIAQRVHLQRLQPRHGAQIAVLRFGRFDHQKGNPLPLLPEFIQDVEQGIGLAAAGNTHHQPVLDEILPGDQKPVAGRLLAIQDFADVDPLSRSGGQRIGIERSVSGDTVAGKFLSGQLEERGQFAGM